MHKDITEYYLNRISFLALETIILNVLDNIVF